MDDGVVQWEVEGVEGEREGEVSRLQRRSRARRCCPQGHRVHTPNEVGTGHYCGTEGGLQLAAFNVTLTLTFHGLSACL